MYSSRHIKMIAILVALCVLPVLSACNTARGVGKDTEDVTREAAYLIEEAGYFVSDTIRDITN